MNSFYKRCNFFRSICVSCLIITLLGGCEPLRKKFVRKKKKSLDDMKMQPVLDPIDYFEAESSPKERYRRHYLLWKYWHNELISVVNDDGSTKKVVFVIDKIIYELNQMRAFLEGKKKELLTNLIEEIHDIEDKYNKNVFINKNSMRRNLLKLEKKIRKEFKSDQIKDDLKNE